MNIMGWLWTIIDLQEKPPILSLHVTAAKLTLLDEKEVKQLNNLQLNNRNKTTDF